MKKNTHRHKESEKQIEKSEEETKYNKLLIMITNGIHNEFSTI